MPPIIVQVIGYIGILMNLIIYQQKTRRTILICKRISDVVWAVHYFALGAMAGFAVALIGAVREIAFIKVDRKSKIGRVLLTVFIIAALAAAYLTWEDMTSLLPAAASVTSVVGFFLSIPPLSRILSFPISICMGIYSFTNGSFAGVINEILTVLSSIVGIIRLDVGKNKRKSE